MDQLHLSEAARRALERAHAARFSYAVLLLRSPLGVTVALLGETHLKLPHASLLGKDIVQAFALRGVEGFPVKRVFLGRILMVLIAAPRIVVRALSFGLIRDSTIKDARDAKHGHTFAVESVSAIPLGLHVASLYLTLFFAVAFLTPLAATLAAVFPPLAAWLPWLAMLSLAFQLHMLALVPAYLLRKFPWSWVIHPAVAILGVRDKTMAEGTAAMLKAHDVPRAAVVIVGRAHLSGLARELIEQHQFRRVD
jgi:hypothetical protein